MFQWRFIWEILRTLTLEGQLMFLYAVSLDFINTFA
jgi:hypothetical protein